MIVLDCSLTIKYIYIHVKSYIYISLLFSWKTFLFFLLLFYFLIKKQILHFYFFLIENLIARETPMLKILRLMCLQSICCNGFGKKYDEFRREILQTYGYEYVFTLDNLEKLGLLRKSNSIYDFSKVRNAFGLYVENPNVEVPNDLSYVSVWCFFSVFSNCCFFCLFLVTVSTSMI